MGQFCPICGEMRMLNLQLPEPTDFPASVFDQTGTLIFMGPREYCEQLAEQVRGLYCYNINGKPFIRRDYEVTE
jgi:hypothetical protein